MVSYRASSSLVTPSSVAQLVERQTVNLSVVGSIPAGTYREVAERSKAEDCKSPVSDNARVQIPSSLVKLFNLIF